MTPHPLQPPDVFEPEAQGVDRADLRKLNERAVLTIVALNPGVSGAEISRRSGLSPQSVSAMLTGFEQQSLVTRKSVIRGKRGQPATPFELNKKGAFGIGCELGWRHIEIRLVDLGLSNLGHYSRHYPYPDAHTLITEAADASLYALDQLLLERGMSPPVGDPSLWDWTALEPVATEWLDHAAGAIALVLTNTRAMTEFKTAVVDGLMPAPVIARLVGKVQAVLAAGPDNTFNSPTVLQGTRGRSAPSLGAAMLPIYRKLFSRTLEDIMATATP